MKISLGIIENEVCNYYELTPEQLFKRTRKREYMYPRQVFHYLCCMNTRKSLTDIGKHARNEGITEWVQDHSTVLHSRETVRNNLSTYNEDVRDMDYLIELIERHKFTSWKLIPTELNLLEGLINVNNIETIYEEVLVN